MLVAQSCPALCDPTDCSLPGSFVHGILQDPGVGFHSLLQGISLTQGLNPGLLHCRQVLYHLSHQGWEGQVQMQPTELRGLSGMRVSLSSISQEGWWSRAQGLEMALVDVAITWPGWEPTADATEVL